jgi:hypothetical protein
MRWFFDPFRHVYKVDLESELFWFGSKIRRDRAQFYVYRRILYICTTKCCLPFLLIRLNGLSAFSVHTKILLTYSETTSYMYIKPQEKRHHNLRGTLKGF